MKTLKAMFQATPAVVRKVLPAVAVMAVSGAAMAADATGAGAGAFDVNAFIDPVVATAKENMGTIIPIVGGVFAVIWGATSGINIIKKFLNKATS